MDSYALGYEKKKMKSHRCHKILRSMEMTSIFQDNFGLMEERRLKYQIYNFNPDSWKDINIYLTPDRDLRFYTRDVSLNGNTYWLVKRSTNWFMQRPSCSLSRMKPFGEGRRFGGRAIDRCKLHFQNMYRLRVEGRVRVRDSPHFFLLCFDFTTERFGPPLDLPFDYRQDDSVSLSSVREEQLAVLCQRSDTLEMEIWISNKIEPEAASWSKLFVAVNLKTRLTFPFEHGSFFVDRGEKVVVVFDRDLEMHCVAYIIREDGYFKKVDLGEYIYNYDCPVIVCPYVPSSVQIKQATPRGNHVD
ncbi:PREDICTED: F-box/kelch-repeat protein At3g16740-like [Camelina sativa]|uniref:F-box/kelch-repeat protein At3g16740-like n=1 Tax=Camelina sativa TaxID=90675 RepID=A0ABM0T1D9_CAMSA|nr:PREDICTED: F-box/kelch-repeat protein At3g16740-like [Camelina sativa]